MRPITFFYRAPFILLAVLLLGGCDDKVEYKAPGLDFDIEKDLRSALESRRMPRLASEMNCVSCHDIDHKVVGPAWKEVGKRYRDVSYYDYQGTKYPLLDGLVLKVSRGGVGIWGETEMPGIDPGGKHRAELEKLVRFILKLEKR